MAEMTARLDHVGLAVADPGAAAAWYCDVFGLVPELSLRVDAIDLSIEMLIHPAFGYRVELLHRPGTGAGVSGQPANPAEAARRAGYGHVAFAVADLDDAFGRAVARGARPVMPPCAAPEPGVQMAFVADPRATSSNCCTGQGGLHAHPPRDDRQVPSARGRLLNPGAVREPRPGRPQAGVRGPRRVRPADGHDTDGRGAGPARSGAGADLRAGLLQHLRPSGEAFAAVLALAGVDVRQVRVQTMLHGFLNLPASIEPVSDALDLIAEAVAGRVRPGAGAR